MYKRSATAGAYHLHVPVCTKSHLIIQRSAQTMLFKEGTFFGKTCRKENIHTPLYKHLSSIVSMHSALVLNLMKSA